MKRRASCVALGENINSKQRSNSKRATCISSCMTSVSVAARTARRSADSLDPNGWTE